MLPTPRNALLVLALFASPVAATTWVVTDTGDAGDGTCDASCTLRDAVNGASADDHIRFDAALPSPVVITLTGNALSIDTTLQITAKTGVATILTRSGNGRLMELGGNADVLVEGLTFQESHMNLGTWGAVAGGAIQASTGSRLELRDAVFRNNSVTGNANTSAPLVGAHAHGGAIASQGTLIIDRCSFVGNRIQGAGGGSDGLGTTVPGGPVRGGAIFSSGSLSIRNCSFSDNRITAGAYGASAYGGAIYVATGAVADISFTTLIGNQAIPTGEVPGHFPAGSAFGHAVNNNGDLILDSSVIAANVGSSSGACAGTGTTSTRNGDLTDDASCPGTVTVDLDLQFQPINPDARSPHFFPRADGDPVDALPDCLDALNSIAIDVDQSGAPRPGLLTTTAACDYGAMEYTGAIFADGLEIPAPAP